MEIKSFINEVINRSNFLKNNNADEYSPLWPKNIFKCKYHNWQDMPDSFFVKSSNVFFQGSNLVFGDELSFNEFFTSINFNCINLLIHSLNPKATLILNDKNVFRKYKRNSTLNVIYLNYLLEIISIKNLTSLKPLNTLGSFLQIFLIIIIFIFLRPSSIMVTNMHKYWRIILIANFFNIKTFFYVNDINLIRDNNITLDIINKFSKSIPKVFIYPSKYSLYQFKDLSSNRNFKNCLLNRRNDNQESILVNKKDVITIIGYLNYFNQFTYNQSLEVASIIISKMQEKYNNKQLNFLPINNFDYQIFFEIRNKYKIIKDFNKLLCSEKVYSFYLNGSLTLYENFGIPSTIVTINNKYKDYLASICSSLNSFNILNINL